MMIAYQFSVILPTVPMTPEGILDATDALGNAGCTDVSIRGHADGIELLFECIVLTREEDGQRCYRLWPTRQPLS